MSHPLIELIENIRCATEFPEDELESILQSWEESLPLLIGALGKSLDEVDRVGPESAEQDLLPFIFIIVLSARPTESAFPVLLRLAAHPQVEELLGDALLEILPGTIAACWDGALSPLEALVVNPELNEFARTSVWNAMLGLAAHDRISLADLGRELRAATTRGRDLGSAILWGAIAMSVAHLPSLGPDIVPSIRRAFDEGWIEEEAFPRSEFETELAQAADRDWREEILLLHCRPVDDAMAELESWFATDPSEHMDGDDSDWHPPPVEQTASVKIGRNDPCPCGSGAKHKKCCGK